MSAAAQATVPSPFVVAATRRESSDTVTLELEPAGGGFSYKPGQFTMLYAFGVGEIPISVSGDHLREERLVHTVRAVGAVSTAICAAPEGETLGVRGPFGRGWPVEEAAGQDLMLVAGGLGLAPLRPALYAALHERERFGRVILLYGGRTPDALIFNDELSEWEGRDDVEYLGTVDAADAEWRGRVGVVPGLIAAARIDPARTVAMVCGPEVMMRFSVDALRESAVPDERIFVSMERNMRCAVGHCGHCQLAGSFVCRDGPVFPWPEISPIFGVREL